jgi:hypothetical protein
MSVSYWGYYKGTLQPYIFEETLKCKILLRLCMFLCVCVCGGGGGLWAGSIIWYQSTVLSPSPSFPPSTQRPVNSPEATIFVQSLAG